MRQGDLVGHIKGVPRRLMADTVTVESGINSMIPDAWVIANFGQMYYAVNLGVAAPVRTRMSDYAYSSPSVCAAFLAFLHQPFLPARN
jgi:hypothetical protein